MTTVHIKHLNARTLTGWDRQEHQDAEACAGAALPLGEFLPSEGSGPSIATSVPRIFGAVPRLRWQQQRRGQRLRGRIREESTDEEVGCVGNVADLLEGRRGREFFVLFTKDVGRKGGRGP